MNHRQERGAPRPDRRHRGRWRPRVPGWSEGRWHQRHPVGHLPLGRRHRPRWHRGGHPHRLGAAVGHGAETIQRVGKANLGDKTMLDALLPFVDAFDAGLDAGTRLALADSWPAAAAVAPAVEAEDVVWPRPSIMVRTPPVNRCNRQQRRVQCTRRASDCRSACRAVRRAQRRRRSHHRTASDLRELAPPELASPGCCRHVAAAPARNDARSPHSSGSSAGCSS